jgi:hypothetical protein
MPNTMLLSLTWIMFQRGVMLCVRAMLSVSHVPAVKSLL